MGESGGRENGENCIRTTIKKKKFIKMILSPLLLPIDMLKDINKFQILKKKKERIS